MQDLKGDTQVPSLNSRLRRRFVGKVSLSGLDTATPENTRIYAIGDIHGRADLLLDLRARIMDDARLAEPAIKKCAPRRLRRSRPR
ncbi:MAG TPA: hypothetical protein EYQ81_01300 [Sneathiellales bacterium]|nr:hypothetical protein [Sneathiellales bacterium]